MSQSIHLHTYSDRARLSETVVYEYNRRINDLRAWPWYVTKNSPIDHNLTSILAGHQLDWAEFLHLSYWAIVKHIACSAPAVCVLWRTRTSLTLQSQRYSERHPDHMRENTSLRVDQNLGAVIWVSMRMYLPTANSPLNRGNSSNGAFVLFLWVIDRALPSTRLVTANFTVPHLDWVRVRRGWRADPSTSRSPIGTWATSFGYECSTWPSATLEKVLRTNEWVTVVVKWKTEVGADWDVWKISGILWISLHNAQPLNSPDWLAKTGIWASCLRSSMLEWHQESWAHSSGNCLTNVNFAVLLRPEEHSFCTYAQKS